MHLGAVTGHFRTGGTVQGMLKFGLQMENGISNVSLLLQNLMFL